MAGGSRGDLKEGAGYLGVRAREGKPAGISACRARPLREEGDEPDCWARAVSGCASACGAAGRWVQGRGRVPCSRAERSELQREVLGQVGSGARSWAITEGGGWRRAECVGAGQRGTGVRAELRCGHWAEGESGLGCSRAGPGREGKNGL